MASKIFFLSHSSADKNITRQVAGKLGNDQCWIDEGEIRPGDSLFDKIDSGIADSRVFVLFWSQHSAGSTWVREELSQARVRALRDRGYRLVLLRVDETPLPDALAHRLYLDLEKGVDYVVDQLRQFTRDLSSEISLDAKEALDPFQNREPEVSTLETLANDSDNGGILLLGLAGMGKSALVRRAVSKVFPHLLPIWLDIDLLSTPLRLLAAAARPLSLSIDLEEAAANPIHLWETRLLPEIAASPTAFVVVDNVVTPRALLRGAAIGELVQKMVTDLVRIPKKENPGLIVIAGSRPDFDTSTISRLAPVHLRALEDRHMVRGLRVHLRRTSPDRHFSAAELTTLASALKGYPLALGIAAAQVAERGLEQVVEDLQQIQRQLIRLAQELLAGIAFTADERHALSLIATAERPLKARHLTVLLGDLHGSLQSLTSKQLFDITPSGLALHGILQDYVKDYLTPPEEIKAAHKKVAELFKQEWRAAPDFSPAAAEFASLTCYHALAAGTQDALNLGLAFREEVKEAAIELYRRRDYQTALTYLEHIRNVPGGQEPIINFYYALTLNRMRRSTEALPILKELASKEPLVSRYHHALGTVFRQLNNPDEAVRSYRRAVATARKNDTLALVSLAELLLELGHPQDALSYAKIAYDRDPGDSSTISTLAGVHHAMGDHGRALELLDDGLRRRRSDVRLHAKAGVIAKQTGNLLKAEEHLVVATSNSEMTYAFTALADVYIQLKKYDQAANTLAAYPVDGTHRDASYWSTYANVLRHQGHLEDGLKAIRAAIEIETKNPVHRGGLAQLHLDLARHNARSGHREKALMQIEQAQLAVGAGLALDPDNEALRSIAKSIASFESI